MIYLITPEKAQYKANLHCHSTLSDGHRTPSELKSMYKSHGYSILSITDHERPYSHAALTDSDFIMITGYECYIRPHPMGIYDRYNKEVHLNLFAREQENVKHICFNDRYAKYIKRDGALGSVVRAGSELPREFTVEYVNKYIQSARENGYLVAYNHPYWSMDDEARILAYEGLFSLEICNFGSFVASGIEHNGPLYDKMLRTGRRIFCHAADDNHNGLPEEHPGFDSFGAFTMIYPKEFTYSAIIDAMESGDMYASMGPVIRELAVDGDTLHIECSEAARIFAYFGSKQPASRHSTGEPITSADLKIDREARYLRVAVQDERGRWANTRGYFRREIGFQP